MDAVRNGHIPVARMLVEKHQVQLELFLLIYVYINVICIYFAALQASPTAVDVLGTQPVHQVAVTGQEEALRYLVLDLRVDVNQRTADNRLTALHYAAKVTSQ